MTRSVITKKIIGKSLKKLMLQQEFEHISVVDIMHLAQIRRQTFYNYFLDKHELLEWIFEDELKEVIQDNLDFYDWKMTIALLFEYLDNNRLFYKNAFSIIGQNAFGDFFVKECEVLLKKVFLDLEKKEKVQIPQEERSFFICYHARAMSAWIKEKLSKNSSLQEAVPSICFTLSAQINGYKK